MLSDVKISYRQVFKESYSFLDTDLRKKSFLSIVLSTINAVLEMLALVLIYPLIILITKRDEPVGETFKVIDNLVSVLPEQDRAFWIGVVIAIIYILKNVFFLSYSWWQLCFIRTASARFSVSLLKYYMTQSYSWHLNKNSAELMRNVNGSVITVFRNVVLNILNSASELLNILGILLILLSMEPQVMIGIILFLVISTYTFQTVFSKISIKAGKNVESSNLLIIKNVMQSLGALKEMRLLGRDSNLYDHFETHKKIQVNAYRDVAMISLLPKSYLEIILILTLLIGVFLVNVSGNPEHLYATLGIFIVGAFRMLPSISKLLSMGQAIAAGIASLNNVKNDLNKAMKVDPDKHISEEKLRSRLRFNFKIELSNVGHSYEDNTVKVLDDINLEIKKGAYIGIVGETGAGKSSLIDVLTGILEPSQGKVFVDGDEITGNYNVWNGALGYVPQMIYLIDDTVRNNIAIGLDGENINDERLMDAIKKAQLSDFIDHLSDGIDTIVGERGVRISGGERQRIGIARALYSDPEIIIFDEGTSSLDAQTEANISKSIEGLRGDKTIIVIAHRLSTVVSCDEIIYLQDGKVLGKGKFEALVKENPTLKAMVNYSDMSDYIVED
ncbi:MAG: ABC-type multidrug transport system fused ATPase/permease subunit [Enterobacterales bacterium]|jgi:ABC-type multidrug transport system fused ATPase/permease subunit